MDRSIRWNLGLTDGNRRIAIRQKKSSQGLVPRLPDLLCVLKKIGEPGDEARPKRNLELIPRP